MDDMKRCPYCAEHIRAEAIRCRYCHSRLTSFDPERWHRSHAEARVAGVCAALSHVLAVPIALVRLIFVILTFFHLLGVLLYVGLAVVIPARPGEVSVLEWALQRALALAATVSGRRPPDAQKPPTDAGPPPA